MLPWLAYLKYSNLTLARRFRKIVAEDPEKVLYVNASTGQEWTRREVEEYSNRVANFFLEKGFKKGDTVAFFMNSRPEYIIHWFGLSKIGVIPALINYNLRRGSLLHTVKVVNCKAVLYGLELEPGTRVVKISTNVIKLRESLPYFLAIKEIQDDILEHTAGKFGFFHTSKGSGSEVNPTSAIAHAINLDDVLRESSPAQEPSSINKSISVMDMLCYIYTSGTTGLPKAVDVRHLRQCLAVVSVRCLFSCSPDYVMYCSLPLYHSAGGQMGTGGSLVFGNKTVIAPKFSARSFFRDCAKYNVDVRRFNVLISRFTRATCKYNRNHFRWPTT